MGVTFVLGFISNKVVAVFLGPSGMAILGNFRNLGAMLKSVATLGISTSLVKLVAENKENKTALSELYATFLSVFIIISSFLAIGVFFFAEAIGQLLFHSNQWTIPIRIVGLSLPLVLLTTFWLAIYNGLEQFKTIVLVQLVSSVLVFIVTISLIYFHSIDGAIWAIALSELLMVLVTFVFVVKDKRFFQFKLRFLIKKDYLIAIQKFSAMALLTAIIAPLTLLLIRNAITTNYSLVEAGYWEATTKLSSFYMLFFTSGLSLYYMPKLASLSTDEAFKQEVKVYFSSFVPLFLVMLLISIRGFSQECPCVKTAIIGTDAKASTIHNNKLVTMDNVTIKLGESINLFTEESTGKVSWFKDEKLIENTLVSPKETTEYTAKSTINGCLKVIAKIQVKVEKPSIEDINNSVVIYPNPTNDYVTISSNSQEIKSIQINNMVGGNLKTFKIGNNLKQQTLNISDLITGVYVVIIEVEGNNTITKKLIKN